MKVTNGPSMNYPKTGEILKRLLFEKNMTGTDLARQINLPQPTIQRLVAGTTTKPHFSSLLAIAKFFNITVDQLRGIEPITWPGWEKSFVPTLNKIPVVTLEQVALWHEIQQEFKITFQTPVVWAEKIPTDKAFAIIMPDASMYPHFDRGSLLIFDPEKKPYDRCFVIAALQQPARIIFRQLVLDGNKCYLKALNPDLGNSPMIHLESSDRICGVLVQAHQNYEE